MRREAATAVPLRSEPVAWRGGVFAGLVGGLVMGAVVGAMNPEVLTVAIPSLYGLAPPPNPVAGWVVHLAHAAVFGAFFAGVARLADVGSSFGVSVTLGVAYGVVAWLVGAGLVMPLWLDVVGSPAGVGLAWPALDPTALLWHVAFGVVVGATFPLLRGR